MTKNIMLHIALTFFMAIGLVVTGFANDLAFYSGPTNPGWISPNAVKKNVKVIMNDPTINKTFNKIEDFGDGDEVGKKSPLAKWTINHTGNGQQDVLVLACGTTPSGLYPFPNLEPDGSAIEEFIETGNILINVADWIFYMSYEGGVRSPDNGPAGAANVFDIPGLSFGSRANNMKPTAQGKKYIPSLKAFVTDRPWHVEQFKGSDWDLVIFAEADASNADPAVAISKKSGKDGTGIISAMWQKAQPDWADGPDPRGIGVIEFMNNWLSENATFAVDARGKMATQWAAIKSQ